MAEQAQEQPQEQPPQPNDDIGQPAAAFSVAAAMEGVSQAKSSTPAAEVPSVAGRTSAAQDLSMAEGTIDSAAASPAPAPAAATSVPSPMPARGATPQRNAAATATNGERGEAVSRAASVLPDQGFPMPAEAPAHGAPVRQYINSKVTGVLLEGVKMVAREQPRDPLRMLGEFLLQRSRELEGTG